MATVSQKSLWKLPRTMLPRRRSRDAPELTYAPVAPAASGSRKLAGGEQLTPAMDLVVHQDDSGQVYRCVGSMWCGAEEWLLLVERGQVEQSQTTAKRVVSRELVRVVEVK